MLYCAGFARQEIPHASNSTPRRIAETGSKVKKTAIDTISAFRTGKGLKGQLLRGGVGSVAVKIGSSLLNVLLAIVLARTLGVEGFGVYSFVFALITVIAIPAQMGLPNLVVRETAKAQAAGDWALMKGLWRWSTLMALMISAALMAIGALAAWVFAARLPEGGLTVFYWGLVLVPLLALGNLRGAALRGLRHVVQGQLPEFILRPAFLIALVLAAHFGLSARALTAPDAMMLHAVASLMAFMGGSWMLLRARPQELNVERNPTAYSSLWLKSAIPLGLIAGINIINQQVGILGLGMFRTAEDVAIYRVAMQGAAAVSIGLMAANTVVAPHIARIYTRGEKGRLQELAAHGARLATFVTLPLFILIIVLGDELIKLLFGASFSAASTPLAVLSAGQLVNALTMSVGVMLTMTGHERDTMKVNAASMFVNLTLVLLFVPHLGVTGAALASGIALTIQNVLLWKMVHVRIGVETTFFRSVRS